MKTITLLRKSLKKNQGLTSYRLDLEITLANGITKDLFVKQRIKKYDGTDEDTFVAVASPAHIEDIDARSPAKDSSYFRTNTCSIVSSDPVLLEEAFQNILGELQLLVDQADVLDALDVDGVYSISSTSILVDMADHHTHYRIPIYAQPSGVNNVYIDETDGLTKHSVTNQDTNIPGWLNTTGGDPVGYKFKYNIDKDPALGAVWPVADTHLQYAHVEINGVVNNDVLINADGIYWKSDLYGQVPWPRTYDSPGEPWADPTHRVVLVFDTIH